jgi:acetoin:2,6-dichlorophenolindophenol oxidoreductase subunit alpha
MHGIYNRSVSDKATDMVAGGEHTTIHAVDPDREGEVFSLIKQVRLWEMYAAMVRCRMTAETAREMRARGRDAANLEAALGWEASTVALAVDLHAEDGLSTTPESALAALVKGARLETLLAGPRNTVAQSSAELHGLGVGLLPQHGDNATRLHTACGVAMAHKMRRSGRVVVAFLPDNDESLESSRGALAFCGRHQLPMVLVDLHGSHERANLVQHDADEALAGFAHGIPVIAVDGSDAVAVYRVASEALGRARMDRGATLIECLGPEHEAMRGWRGEEHALDPIVGMEAYLGTKGLFRKERRDAIVAEFQRELEAAIGNPFA